MFYYCFWWCTRKHLVSEYKNMNQAERSASFTEESPKPKVYEGSAWIWHTNIVRSRHTSAGLLVWERIFILWEYWHTNQATFVCKEQNRFVDRNASFRANTIESHFVLCGRCSWKKRFRFNSSRKVSWGNYHASRLPQLSRGESHRESSN